MKNLIRNVVLPLIAGAIVGLALGYLAVELEWIVLFEDGSIQFFHHPGWGLCLVSAFTP